MTKQLLLYLILVSQVLKGQIILHSHNDYEQKYPYYTAMREGFTSLEVDILLHEENLLISHDDKDLHIKPSLQSYLDKLYLIDKANSCIFLLIDIKKYSLSTLKQLHKALSSKDYLFHTRSGNNYHKVYKVVLSGEIPRKEIIENLQWDYFFIDGRPEDLGDRYDKHLMPMISTNFAKYSKWRGVDRIPSDEARNIKNLIMKVHDQQKQIRFWNTEDHPLVWNQLLEWKVDIIGVDHLLLASSYFRTRLIKAY